MFNYQSFRFWMDIFWGNLIIGLTLECYKGAYGTIKNSKMKIEFFFFAIIAAISIFAYNLIPKQIDIPSIFSMNYHETEGKVKDFYEYKGKRGSLESTRLTVEILSTGKSMVFKQVQLPADLDIDDSVKLSYFKYSKVAAITEWNGKKLNYHKDNNNPLGILLIFYLITSMIFRYFKSNKFRFDNFKENFSILVYHNKYIIAVLGLIFIRVQLAILLVIAMSGQYKNLWDWYWGILILLNYLGIFYLQHISRKKFILIKNKFYYSDFNKILEGDLDHLILLERDAHSITFGAEYNKMRIYSNSTKYIDSFMQLLHSRGIK